MSFDNRRSTMEGGATSGASAGEVQSQASVSLCKTGCGFYANAAFEGMCSKCYKEEQQRRQLQQQSEPGANQSNESNVAMCPAAVAAVTIETAQNTDSPAASASTKSSSDITSCSNTENSSAGSDAMRKNDDTLTTLPANSSAVSLDLSTNSSASDISMADETSQDEKSETGKVKKNRCQTCKKRVGLTGFECRCGGLFCSVHRYSDKHDCHFDYKELGQDQIRKNNPVIMGEKIKKL